MERKNKSLNQIHIVESDVELIARIRQIILMHMKEEGFGVLMLCKLAYISRTKLHIKLKSLTNRSTSHYIRLVRIEKACQLLKETNLNISSVSLQIGIESLPYFSRIFKAEMGLSPQIYRKKYQLEQ